ncbi:protein of unknown function [Micromonospora pattaloongensis]|uniref:Protein-glutamine gamma-glutamyltransferase-like C-terminal domain-containing protein n=1 Tax=Micromonospora pattaloongensis TaxID=405436 RepID=A0A1H3M2W9_9ACTN|nr:DUF4129 domain-containing protein [Micromonospora pattaloongensis]SDY71041.1 protein of unknown function [Micromonospora pattaloongensis]
MTFSRWWTETVASLGDLVPLPLVALILLAAAALAAAGWFWFPAWVPRRLPRWRAATLRWRPRRPRWRIHWPRWRWPRRRRARATAPAEAPRSAPGADQLPELPPATLAALADRLAAQGRYAEAVRERLRAMARQLVDRRVVAHRPGWTVTELAGAAGRAAPAVAAPLEAATGIFSELWYGQRPAGPEHDARMRALADQLDRALRAPHAAATGDRP